jgi:hypothetical protein
MARGREGDRDRDDLTGCSEESLNEYYYRQQGTPNRNEVIPTWRKPPPDRNAEPEAYHFEPGAEEAKATDWPWDSQTQHVEEIQDTQKEQHRPDPGNLPSHSRNFGRTFTGSKKAP